LYRWWNRGLAGVDVKEMDDFHGGKLGVLMTSILK
jgi:hypothetical protein